MRDNLWEAKTSKETLVSAKRHIKKEIPEGDQEEGRSEFIVQNDQTRGPESLGEEIDSVEKRGESETGMTRWK